jgi:hypothetical protein
MTENNIKTVYTQDEVKAMMCACLNGINASNGIIPVVDEIRCKLKTYDGSDKAELAAMETALDEIVAFTNEHTGGK